MFHQVAYGVLSITTILRGMYIMEHTLRPALRKRNPEQADQIMKTMWQLALAGPFRTLARLRLGAYADANVLQEILPSLAGFFIWNMDNIFCHSLVAARNYIQLPWAVLLEGHGWWHILTGIGESPPLLHESKSARRYKAKTCGRWYVTAHLPRA